MTKIQSALDYPEGPLRDAFRAGAAAEAHLRDEWRQRLPEKTKQVVDYILSVCKHHADDEGWVATPGVLLRHAVYVFKDEMTREERRDIKRRLRGDRWWL